MATTGLMAEDKELILKVQVPHMGIVKSLRTNTAHRVGQLTAALNEKLETAEKQDFSNFGLYWYNDTGPVWLSETSFIRAYGFKTGDQLQFKAKPAPVVPAPKKSSFLSNRSKTISVITTPTLPSQPSSPSLNTLSPRRKTPVSPTESNNGNTGTTGNAANTGTNGKMSAKDALMKAFQQPTDYKGDKSPPPPSSARPVSQCGPATPTTPTFSSAASSLLEKSASTPLTRPHAATAPPKPNFVSIFHSPSTEHVNAISDESISPRDYPTEELSPRSAPSPPSPPPPPSVFFTPAVSNEPQSPPSPPSTIFTPPSPPFTIFTPPEPFTLTASPELPRVPSAMPSRSSSSISVSSNSSSRSSTSSSSPSLSVARPPLSKSDGAQHATPSPPSQPQSVSQVRAYASSSALQVPQSATTQTNATPTHDATTCEHRAKAHAYRDEVERERAHRVKLKQRLDLAECILSDTLQAIDEGESNVGAIKLYLITAIKTLRMDDAQKISFGNR